MSKTNSIERNLMIEEKFDALAVPTVFELKIKTSPVYQFTKDVLNIGFIKGLYQNGGEYENFIIVWLKNIQSLHVSIIVLVNVRSWRTLYPNVTLKISERV